MLYMKPRLAGITFEYPLIVFHDLLLAHGEFHVLDNTASAKLQPEGKTVRPFFLVPHSLHNDVSIDALRIDLLLYH